MSGRLPEQIDPIRLAEEGARLVGELPLGAFPRLREQCRPGSASGPVAIELLFERVGQGVRLMRGRLHVRLELDCQRCLEALTLDLEARPFLQLLVPGEAPTGSEAEVLVVEGPQRLSELVEEELLLVMPMVPMHAEGDCVAPLAPEKKPSPFAVLRERTGKDQQT